MTNYEFSHSVETTASAAAVWALWSDVGRWTEWDAELESVELDGPFEVGSRGRMAIPGQPPIEFTLTEVRPLTSFTDETAVPGAVLRFVHRLEPLADGRLRVTHRVEASGPAATKIGPFVTEDLPAAVDSLVALASSTG